MESRTTCSKHQLFLEGTLWHGSSSSSSTCRISFHWPGPFLHLRSSSTLLQTSSAAAVTKVSSSMLVGSNKQEEECYLVCSASVTWIWHTQACSLRMLEMAQSVARQLQVIGGTSNYTVTIVQGQETPAFIQALKKSCGLGMDGANITSGATSESSSDHEMTGNPQEMSM